MWSMQNGSQAVCKGLGKIARLARGVRNRILNFRVVDRRRAYELWETNTLSRIFDHYKVDCVFDVGANLGQYARMLRTKAGFDGLIVSFEPQPVVAKKLRHFSRNDPKWIVEEVALSTENGLSKFNVMYGSEFSSLSKPIEKQSAFFYGANAPKQEIDVKTETLDNVLKRLQTAHGFMTPFLKLDTQGYDHAIIKAGQGVLASFVGLQSELAVTKLYEDSIDYKEALQDYEKFGFSLCTLVPNNAGHFPRLMEIDCIMIRSDLIK
jgi:FkbM family methyltransferase